MESGTMSIPIWAFVLIITLAVSGIGTAITVAMSYAKTKIVLALVQRSAERLHERVDQLEIIISKTDAAKLSDRLDHLEILMAKLDKDVAILKKLDEREHYTSPHGVPITDPPITRMKK